MDAPGAPSTFNPQEPYIPPPVVAAGLLAGDHHFGSLGYGTYTCDELTSMISPALTSVEVTAIVYPTVFPLGTSYTYADRLTELLTLLKDVVDLTVAIRTRYSASFPEGGATSLAEQLTAVLPSSSAGPLASATPGLPPIPHEAYIHVYLYFGEVAPTVNTFTFHNAGVSVPVGVYATRASWDEYGPGTGAYSALADNSDSSFTPVAYNDQRWLVAYLVQPSVLSGMTLKLTGCPKSTLTVKLARADGSFVLFQLNDNLPDVVDW